MDYTQSFSSWKTDASFPSSKGHLQKIFPGKLSVFLAILPPWCPTLIDDTRQVHQCRSS